MLPVDEQHMRRALELAIRGRGNIEPNPMVGCVLVKDGRAIGEGWHRRFGGPHAEREAIAAAIEWPAGCTAYVTLEPCCHTGKKTPPCVPGLLEAGVRRVVVGCLDPNPPVAGNGVRQLRQAGVEVETGALEMECRQLNAAFFARVLHGRPYVTLKWAQSADGKVAGAGGARRQISSAESMQLVQLLRARSDAILVGINTVLKDDPLLLARGVERARPLVRVVLDTHLRMPLSSRLVRTAGESAVVVICGERAAESAEADELCKRGVEVVGWAYSPTAPGDGGRIHPPYEDPEYRGRGQMPMPLVLQYLGSRGVTHLLVEPGPTLGRSMLEAGAWDRLWRFESPRAMGEPDAPDAPSIAVPPIGRLEVGGDVLWEVLNPKSDAYFGAALSADALLAKMGRWP